MGHLIILGFKENLHVQNFEGSRRTSSFSPSGRLSAGCPSKGREVSGQDFLYAVSSLQLTNPLAPEENIG